MDLLVGYYFRMLHTLLFINRRYTCLFNHMQTIHQVYKQHFDHPKWFFMYLLFCLQLWEHLKSLLLRYDLDPPHLLVLMQLLFLCK